MRKDDHTVVIIGAGIAGCQAALKLSEGGYKVFLADQGELFGENCSSSNQAIKLGLGFHVPHFPSAVLYLQTAYDMALKNPRWVRGHKKPIEQRRAHYFVHKDSTSTLDEVTTHISALRLAYCKCINERVIVALGEKLQEWRYRKEKVNGICASLRSVLDQDSDFSDAAVEGMFQDSLAQQFIGGADETSKVLELVKGLFERYRVFGHPKDFYRVLTPSEYEQEVNTTQVVLGVETAEQVLDTEECKRALLKQIEHDSNITVMPHCKAVDIQHSWVVEPGETPYKVIFEETGRKRTAAAQKIVQAGYVVAAAWQGNDKLVQLLGVPPKEVATRVKATAIVELPKAWEVRAGEKEVHTRFVCFGDFSACTVVGRDGKKVVHVTSEKVTNIYSGTGRLPEDMQRLIAGEAETSEKRKLAARILASAARDFPELKGAALLPQGDCLQYGVVRTEGELPLSQLGVRGAPHSKRTFMGVETLAIGASRCESRKFPYSAENASRLLRHINRQRQARTLMKAARDTLVRDMEAIGLTYDYMPPLVYRYLHQFLSSEFLSLARLCLDQGSSKVKPKLAELCLANFSVVQSHVRSMIEQGVEEESLRKFSYAVWRSPRFRPMSPPLSFWGPLWGGQPESSGESPLDSCGSQESEWSLSADGLGLFSHEDKKRRVNDVFDQPSSPQAQGSQAGPFGTWLGWP